MPLFYAIKLWKAALVVWLVGSLALMSSLPAKAEELQVVTFGIVPQQSVTKLAQNWGPVLKYLSDTMGVRFVFRTAPDIPTFEHRVANGDYDVAYVNPYHFVVFNALPGYRSVARAKDKKIVGITVVHRDSSIAKIQDLNGIDMAFPAPNAFAASMLPQAYLKNSGINVNPVYVSSHDSVYRAVEKGLYFAGGGVMRTFNNLDPSIRSQLRILWETPGYTPHAIAVHPRMSAEWRERLQHVLVNMRSDRRAIPLLKKLGLKGFDAANDSDWDDVRALGISARLGLPGK